LKALLCNNCLHLSLLLYRCSVFSKQLDHAPAAKTQSIAGKTLCIVNFPSATVLKVLMFFDNLWSLLRISDHKIYLLK